MGRDRSDELLNIRQVLELAGCHRATIWRWIKAKNFPQPELAVGRKFRRWRRSKVMAWLESMRAEAMT